MSNLIVCLGKRSHQVSMRQTDAGVTSAGREEEFHEALIGFKTVDLTSSAPFDELCAKLS